MSPPFWPIWTGIGRGATFFVVGSTVRGERPGAEVAHDLAQEIGNHSFTTVASCSCRPRPSPRGGVDGPRDPLRGYRRPILFRPPFGKRLLSAPFYLRQHAHDDDVEPRARLGRPPSPTIRGRWQVCGGQRSSGLDRPAACGTRGAPLRAAALAVDPPGVERGYQCRRGLGDAQRAVIVPELPRPHQRSNLTSSSSGRRSSLPCPCRDTQRRERDGLDVVREAEHVAHGGGVEVGDPARPEPRRCRGEHQVVHGDRRVDLVVRLAVHRAARPRSARSDDDEHQRRLRPSGAHRRTASAPPRGLCVWITTMRKRLPVAAVGACRAASST